MDNRNSGTEDESRSRRRVPRRSIVPCILAVLVIALAAAALFFRFYKPDIIIDETSCEIGDSVPAAKQFLRAGIKKPLFLDLTDIGFVTDVSAIDTGRLGSHELQIRVGRFTYDTQLIVRDTVAPTGETVDLTVMIGEQVTAEDFIASVEDATEVSITFAAEPDMELAGEQEVILVLTDEAGNFTDLTARLTIMVDTTAPVISGVQDQTITVGDTISYKSGVTVTDDIDEKPSLEIDNDQVDLDTPGEYTVTYIATDDAGNRSEVTAVITVEPKDIGEENIDELYRLADRVLREVTYEGQSDVDKLYQMLWWVKRNMKFTGTSDKTSIINEGIKGFTEGYGDCFTYFAVLKALMERAGFETIDIQRVEGYESHHYWSLVKYKGNWYHIDSCPRAVDRYKYWYCFLRTDDEVLNFSRNRVEGYYEFDQSLYPPTPKEKLNTGYKINGDY